MGQINFGAYPRSGNTFTNSSMIMGLIDVDYCAHEHNAHKLLKTQNRFTIIRNPLDSISSAIVHYSSQHDDRVNRFTEWYVDYYTQCSDKKCITILFDELINDPKKTFINLAKKMMIQNHNFDKIDYSLANKNETVFERQNEVSVLRNEIEKSSYFADALDVYNNAQFN